MRTEMMAAVGNADIKCPDGLWETQALGAENAALIEAVERQRLRLQALADALQDADGKEARAGAEVSEVAEERERRRGETDACFAELRDLQGQLQSENESLNRDLNQVLQRVDNLQRKFQGIKDSDQAALRALEEEVRVARGERDAAVLNAAKAQTEVQRLRDALRQSDAYTDSLTR